MPQQIILTEQSEKDLARLSELVAGIETGFLIETALAVTTALYEKSANGAVIRWQYSDGKAEEGEVVGDSKNRSIVLHRNSPEAVVVANWRKP